MAIDFVDPRLLTSLRLVFDTASLVLIWLVQLVIYPSFLYLRSADFKRWHHLYTKRVTYVVLPIMLGQLVVYGWLCLAALSWEVVVNTILVIAVWIITFFWAVPLHGTLDVEDDHLPLSTRLVGINWWRTILWTLVWGVSTWVVLQ